MRHLILASALLVTACGSDEKGNKNNAPMASDAEGEESQLNEKTPEMTAEIRVIKADKPTDDTVEESEAPEMQVRVDWVQVTGALPYEPRLKGRVIYNSLMNVYMYYTDALYTYNADTLESHDYFSDGREIPALPMEPVQERDYYSQADYLVDDLLEMIPVNDE